ncbi:MAG: REP-associated tyrosine transposase [Terriglobia bacterium]
MSHVHRLREADRIFFVTVNLRRALAPFRPSEYARLIAAIDASRAKLGFKLLGYVLMPDHWHALLWTGYPLTISRTVQDVKWLSARALNQARRTSGAVWQHQFWDRFVRHRKEFTDRLLYMHMNPVRKGLVTKPEEW